jgi:deoxyribodipyrimidine photo-lyase
MYFKDDLITLQSWMQGETGEPFIDANMKELLHTGWMSNRGRQNVANFLAKTLKVNWTWGADWFEKRLIDYDPCNNWGNWNYTAGVGTDQRDRTFNPQNQSRMYDPENIYQKKWLN